MSIYVVDRQDRLKTHQEKKHTKKIANSFSCTYCQNVFSSRTHQKDHEKTHLPPPAQSKEFACDICDKSFASKKSLYVHNHKYHDSKKVVNSLGFGVFEDCKAAMQWSFYQIYPSRRSSCQFRKCSSSFCQLLYQLFKIIKKFASALCS